MKQRDIIVGGLAVLLLAGAAPAQQEPAGGDQEAAVSTSTQTEAVGDAAPEGLPAKKMPSWWKEGTLKAGNHNASDAAKKELKVNGSIFYPVYIAEGTVYTRGVADMPLAPNSKAMAQYMKVMPSECNNRGVITSLNATFFNLPVYIVDSRDPATPHVKVTVPDFRSHMVTPKMREILFNSNIPMPDWAKAANPQHGGDSAMAIYDIGTGIIREYFLILKTEGKQREWCASYGGYSENMFDLARKNYACQHDEGSDFATGMIGAPGQIGIEEARHGEIRHAVCFTMANPRKGVTCWPAKMNDGKNENPNAPAEGQWFRLPPALNIRSLHLKPMTELIAKAVQKYGGFGSDRNVFCHAFNAEPGFVEEHVKGRDPWMPGGDLYQKYNLRDNLLNDFPWELTEWAPVDWGKQKR